MTSADSLFTQALGFHQVGDLEGARLHYLAALRAQPNHIGSILNLIDILSRRNQVPAALALMSRVIEAAPKSGLHWSNYGNLLTRLERYDEARVAATNATNLSPDSVAAWHNLLMLELREKNIEAALACYERINDLGGDSPTIQNDLAHIYLHGANLERAYEIYEARWHILQHLDPWDLHLPEWQGEDVNGKRVLVHLEQGFGDTIMTSRFVPRLVERGAKVTFAIDKPLIPLFEAQDWGIEICDLYSLTLADAGRFDLHTPLYSMMRWLSVKREDISPKPYLKVPQITVPPVFGGMFNVGICWFSGRRGTYMDWRRRVSPLIDWLRLSEIPNIQLWSLCPGGEAQAEIVRIGAEAIVLDEVTRFESFAETAAFIDRLDLVITVDTAVAHLAAAMGKPTWMLAQHFHCWRWWGLDEGTGRPWYDSMEIFPQHESGDWKSQLEACRQKLMAQVEPKLRAVA